VDSDRKSPVLGYRKLQEDGLLDDTPVKEGFNPISRRKLTTHNQGTTIRVRAPGPREADSEEDQEEQEEQEEEKEEHKIWIEHCNRNHKLDIRKLFASDVEFLAPGRDS